MAKKVYIGVENFIPRDLPEGYTQVEYIESNGTQHIDTGFKPNQDTRVVMEFEFISEYDTSSSTMKCIFGCRDTNLATAPNQYCLWNSGEAKFRTDYFGSNQTITVSAQLGRKTVDKNKNITTIDGISATNAVSTGQCSYNLTLFALNAVGSILYKSTIKSYSCLVYDNRTLIRDYVPCINPNGVAGLYDMVNKVFDAGVGTFIAGDAIKSVARRVKNGHIGVETLIPIYEEGNVTKTITGSDYKELFSVTNERPPYDFVWNSAKSRFETNMKLNSNFNNTYWTALCDLTISFDYGVSSESNYDKFSIIYNYTRGNTNTQTPVVNNISGTTTGNSGRLELLAGDKLHFYYTKDSSAASGDDCGYIQNVQVTYIGQVIAGYESKDVARLLKKGYIGIGGVARPFMSSEELAYYGTITGLSVARYWLAATTVGNFALFGGGFAGDRSSVVDAYNNSLTRTTATAFPDGAKAYLAATTVGNNALFGGGQYKYSDTSGVDAYNSSLTATSITPLTQARYWLAATTVGNNALFGGGQFNNAYTSVVDSYDNSLTRTTPTALSYPRRNLAATTVGGHALFGGGDTGSTYFNVVDAYNASLTRTDATRFGTPRNYLAATTVGEFAIFGGGKRDDYTFSDAVDVYDTSLTQIKTTLHKARGALVATTAGNFAIFTGGYGINGDSTTEVDVFNESLTMTFDLTLFEKKAAHAGTTVGNYALFGGGEEGTGGALSTVDAFVVA